MVNGAAGTLITNSGTNEANFQFGGNAGQSGTFAGNILPGAKPVSVDYFANGSTETVTGTITADNFYQGNGFGTLNLGPTAVVSTSFTTVGQNTGGSFSTMNVNGATISATSNGGNTLRIGWNGTGVVNLNSGGTIVAPFINRSGGGGTNNGIVITGGTAITQRFSNDTNFGAGMFVVLNGGTIQVSASDNLFADTGESQANEVSVQIGAGGTINTNGVTSFSQRPLMNVTGSSTLAPLPLPAVAPSTSVVQVPTPAIPTSPAAARSVSPAMATSASLLPPPSPTRLS